jgi:hypothetical protein
MPRNAGARMKMFGVVAALAALVAACGDDRAVATEAGVSPPKDAAPDDAMVEDSGTDSSVVDASEPPWSEPEGGVIDNLMDEYCVLRIAAECDGREDCPGGACCARFEPSMVAFTAMTCQELPCDYNENSFPLCHEGETCTADGQLTCRTSLLIPHDFIGVCLPRTPLASPPPTGEAVKGMIDCGSQQCVVGAEQCCLREGFDVRRVKPVKYEPYCAPIGEPCDCTEVDIPPRDGGMPNDEDAGR